MHTLSTAAIVVGLAALFAAAPARGGDAPPAMQAAPLGAKWPTDEPLRKGMLAIRDLVRINHSLITHRRMPPDHAARFAAAIKAQSDQILATSATVGAAKEELRALLDGVVAGVEAVAGRRGGVAPIDGLMRVDAALARYPERFDHPDWAPVQSLD
jgi:hypothetical protein